MTEKEKETKDAKVDEKRLKPSLIRRRAAPKVEEPPAPVVVEAPAPAIAAATPQMEPEAEAIKPAVEVVAVVAPETTARDDKKPKHKVVKGKEGAVADEGKEAPKRPKKSRARAAAEEMGLEQMEGEVEPEAFVTAVEAKAEEPLPPVVEAPSAQAPAVVEEKLAQAPVSDAVKKETKFFAKEPEVKKFFVAKPVRKGNRYKDKQRQTQQTNQSRLMKKTEITVPKASKRVIRIVDAISVADFSQRLGVKAGELIKRLMGLGIMATVNQLVDADAATLVAQEYGYEVESTAVVEETLIVEPGQEMVEQNLVHRAPVVTVMGHVDHGKTSLLDAIRSTNVVSAEAGGITQHIGAYHVHLERGDVTFLDTPGHEAFTAMRARGAKATDIVILVVAADDGVMPQTIEAINHAKAAGVPIIVAINKIDLPQADPKRIKQELTQYGLVSEEWGGDTIFIEVSAKKRIMIKELLELILLQSEMLELKADPQAQARGVVVEAKLDKGRGPVSTVLIQNGTLKVGDACVTGVNFGRIRAMISDWGKRVDEAGPSMPIEIFGLSGVPVAGDPFVVVKDEATAKQIATLRLKKAAEKDRMKTAKVSLADLYDRINKGEVKELKIIVKADVQGSIEALKESLGKLSTEAIKLNIIHNAVGGVSEGDVMLASASDAIIIGFNVRPEPKAQALADKESVDVRLYNIIYNVVDDIKNAMEGMLAPIVREEALGRAEIRDVLKITKVGPVAGCFVTEGKAVRGARARLVRDSVVVYDGKLGSLRRFKDDVKEVASGYECGMTIDGYNDIKVGDVIELYTLKEEAAKL